MVPISPISAISKGSDIAQQSLALKPSSSPSLSSISRARAFRPRSILCSVSVRVALTVRNTLRSSYRGLGTTILVQGAKLVIQLLVISVKKLSNVCGVECV